MRDEHVTSHDDVLWYRRMLDCVVGCLAVRLDHEGVVQTWHPGAQALTGYTHDEVVGRSVAMFFPADDATDGHVAGTLRAAADSGRHEADGWFIRRDGSRFWATVAVCVPHDTAPTRDGFVFVVRDLTMRRDAEQALASMSQMIDGITDFEVIRLDENGLVRSWNPGARMLTQYVAGEVLGQHVAMFYPDEDVRARLPEREMAAAVRDGRLETEGWRVRKDGTRFWVNAVMSTIRDTTGELIGFVKVARDLTERREQEQLVQRQRDEILDLSTPVIQVWDSVLVLPIIGTLDSVRASRLTEGLLERIAVDQAEVVILDVSGVPTIDTDVAQHLLKTVEAARLMGTTSILSGVRPETAQAIVHLGIELGRLRSRNTLKDALQVALRLVGAPLGDERVTVDA
jgi:PAS domain S-box-containing protein